MYRQQGGTRARLRWFRRASTVAIMTDDHACAVRAGGFRVRRPSSAGPALATAYAATHCPPEVPIRLPRPSQRTRPSLRLHRLASAGRAALAAGIAASLAALPGGAAAQEAPAEAPAVAAQPLAQLLWLTLVLAAVVLLLVLGLLLYTSLRFRRRLALPAQEPPQVRTDPGSQGLETLWALVPALLVLGLFGASMPSLAAFGSPPAGAMRIRVEGSQFAWNFDYLDEGVVAPTNELRVPVGEPVVLEVASRDVVHSFWIPDLQVKSDAIPGRLTRTWFTAPRAGTYRAVCAELCGAGHSNMQVKVEALPRDQFDQWLQAERSGAPRSSAAAGSPAGGVADEGKALIATRCATCHVVPGVPGATGTIGPSLAGVASRTRIAGGAVPNNGLDDLKRWILNPPGLKPGTLMPNLGLSDDEATKIATYLETLK